MQQSALLRLKDIDYSFPPELIAMNPLKERSDSRLLVVDRKSEVLKHRTFSDIVNYLHPGDLLILNNTKVIPARLIGRKPTGGKVEVFLLKKIKEDRYEALLKPKRRLKVGTTILFDDHVSAVIVKDLNDKSLVEFNSGEKTTDIISRFGRTPLPPYINRDADKNDKERYQTVFALKSGSSAAPTAGLHFDNALLKRVEKKGIEIGYVTLHVGYGTFQKIETDCVASHKMHSESFEISKETATKICRAKKANRRIVAVGTTSVRVLESVTESDLVGGIKGETDIFIYPPYQFKWVDALITNFHQPKSTLLCMVSAFAGYDLIMQAYQEAIKMRYRLFSYGDAMLICDG